MAIYKNNPIVINGLFMALDAANRISYVSGSSTWIDISANRFNASLTGSPIFLPNEVGGSIELDGINDSINLSGSNCVLTSSRTATLIIRSNQTTSVADYFRFFEGTTNGLLRLEWNNQLVSTNESGTSFAFQSEFTPAFPLDRSYFMITFRCDNTGRLNIFNNSILTTVNVLTSGSINITNIGRTGGTFTPGGAISTFLFYNRSLTDAEIIQNYNALKSRLG